MVACKESNTGKEINFRKDAELRIVSEQNEIVFEVELADTPARRVQGLMFRYKMEPNQGMFFIFDHEEPQSFWMKNTYLSLDMIFIDENFQIVQIYENAFPLKEEPIVSDYPARYVLEILGGTAKMVGIEIGNSVELKNKRYDYE